MNESEFYKFVAYMLSSMGDEYHIHDSELLRDFNWKKTFISTEYDPEKRVHILRLKERSED